VIALFYAVGQPLMRSFEDRQRVDRFFGRLARRSRASQDHGESVVCDLFGDLGPPA